jgi:hypothetical protein
MQYNTSRPPARPAGEGKKQKTEDGRRKQANGGCFNSGNRECLALFFRACVGLVLLVPIENIFARKVSRREVDDSAQQLQARAR